VVEAQRKAGHSSPVHIATLGSIVHNPTTEQRMAFWTKVHQRLGTLSNRIDIKAQSVLMESIHKRVPIPTQADQQITIVEAVKADVNFRNIMADMHDEKLAGLYSLVALTEKQIKAIEPLAKDARENANIAQDHLARAEKGEMVPTSPPMTREQIMKAGGWTERDMQHMMRLAEINRLGGWDAMMKEMSDTVQKESRKIELRIAKATLERLKSDSER
jgi:hypothetical protein